MSTEPGMSTSGKTIKEVSELVTGFDEIAVEKHLGLDIYNTTKGQMQLRAVVFVDQRHSGVKDVEARKYALGLTNKALNEYFEEPGDLDPDDPETPSGKDV